MCRLTKKKCLLADGQLDIDESGRCLLQFCAPNGLCIVNTFFQQKRNSKVYLVQKLFGTTLLD